MLWRLLSLSASSLALTTIVAFPQSSNSAGQSPNGVSAAPAFDVAAIHLHESLPHEM